MVNQSSFSVNDLDDLDLKETVVLLTAIFDNIPDPICIKDVEDRIIKCNSAALSFWNTTKEKLIGSRCTELKICHNPCKQSMTSKAYQLKKTTKIEKFIKQKNAWVEVMVYPVLDRETNEVQFLIEHVKDITQLKNHIEVRNKLVKKIQEQIQLQTEFFANISHELKTPLNVILSTLQLLENYYLVSEKASKYTKMMKQNCFRLLKLLNNMIDMTKIESGYFKLHLENHDIVNIIKQITLSVDQYIEHRSIRLSFESEVNQKIMACDLEKLERIMLNLLSNAAKFTPPGGEIKVKISERDQFIIISVKDTGIGIPSEKQNLIFKRFGQVDSKATRHNEGSGIGLSLVKSLVEMHGGSIRFTSEYQKGTEFILKFPIKVLDQESEKSSHYEGSSYKNVETIHIEFSDIYKSP